MRAVLFDLDGVLVQTREMWFRVMNQVAAELGYAAISSEQFARAWGQSVEEDVARFYPRHTVDELEREYWTRLGEHVEHLTVEPGAAECLAALEARGLRTAVVTNTPRGAARELLEAARLRVGVLVGGTDVPRAKPAPDMVLRACERLRVRPGDALLVGDSDCDREAARRAGAAFAGLRLDAETRVEGLLEVVALTTADRHGPRSDER